MATKEGSYNKLHSAFLQYWAWLTKFWHSDRKYMRPALKTARLLIVLILLVLINRCTHLSENVAIAHRAAGTKPPAMVVLAAARTRDVPVYLTALGSVISTGSVTIKSQVNGQLLRVLFQEGQMVNAKDLIAEIDERPYKAILMQYEGQLARDTALLANAKLDFNRYQQLFRQDSVAKQTLDTQISLVKQYEGTVKSDQGLVEMARVNLAYCRITSPIDGRVGLRLVDTGNFVQTTDTSGLVIINTVNPITVVFSLPEDSLQQIMKPMNDAKKLKVEAYDRWQNKLLVTGDLLAIDNQIDLTTGTVKLKAQFQNDDNSLFPNQFVNIRLLVNTLHDATVVPTAAIQHGVNGSFIYVANKDLAVKMTPVSVGPTVEDDTVVTKGVLPGETVVIEGTDKLTDGVIVTVSRDTLTPDSSTGNPRQSHSP